jgi:hypothetical protein
VVIDQQRHTPEPTMTFAILVSLTFFVPIAATVLANVATLRSYA